MEIRAAYVSQNWNRSLNCVAWRSIPMDMNAYWQYMRGDSSYRLPQTRVVVVNDRVVATLRVWERRMRIGDFPRNDGRYWRCLHTSEVSWRWCMHLLSMRDTIDYLRTIGCDIGALFSIIPEAFYQRLGWDILAATRIPIDFQLETPAADRGIGMAGNRF